MKNALVLLLSVGIAVPSFAFLLSTPKPQELPPLAQHAELKTAPKAAVTLPEVKITASRTKAAPRAVLADNSVPCGAGFWDQKTRCVKPWR
jgi:hypothetical protein